MSTTINQSVGSARPVIVDRLALAMLAIRQGEAECVFDAIDDQEAADEAEAFRHDIEQIEKQCGELCELLPQHVDKYRRQAAEELGRIEQRVATKLRTFPWTFIHEHARRAA